MKTYDLALVVIRTWVVIGILQCAGSLVLGVPVVVVSLLPLGAVHSEVADGLVGDAMKRSLSLASVLGPLSSIAINLIVFAFSRRLARFIANFQTPGREAPTN